MALAEIEILGWPFDAKNWEFSQHELSWLARAEIKTIGWPLDASDCGFSLGGLSLRCLVEIKNQLNFQELAYSSLGDLRTLKLKFR